MKRSHIIIIAATGLVLLLFLCLVAAGVSSFFLIARTSQVSSGAGSPASSTTGTPFVIRPTSENPSGGNLQSPSSAAFQTLKSLENTIVPENNLPDLAERLEGKMNIPLTMTPPTSPLTVGAQQEFWISNTDTNQSTRVPATLQYVTAHVYFWIEDGVSFHQKALQKLADTFENKIYPRDREFFGSEWTPGVDDDPHLYILYAKGLGGNVAGYFSSADEYSPLAHEYSNAHEMFILNADQINLDESFTYGVLAHEFQHMIHWYRDRNEKTWMNEGFSVLASFLNGYGAGGVDKPYTQDPDLQLNDWPNNRDQTGPHYGAAFLFLDYFLNRFGEAATKSLVGDPENGLASVDDVLSGMNARDGITGKPITADDLYLDWVIANYLQDGTVADGRYDYQNYPSAPKPSETETIRKCPQARLTRGVHQYGVDYIRITCSGDYTLSFEGSTQTTVLPERAHSGDYAFWSNKGGESDMTLTRTFDFTGQSGPLTFSYWAWYDLEKDYDYLYLEASTDGKDWQILKTPFGTAEDPSGNSYGWGYNGTSDGWIQEQVDLSHYAGKTVQLRFEYITDVAVNGEGFLLDDISIPQVGYSTDFEKDNGGWEAAGWVRIQNVLPQTYRLALISFGSTTSVEKIDLPAENTIDLPIHIGGRVDHVVFVVSGTTRFTRQQTGYRIQILP